jgi:hypothetical protein
LSKTKSHGSTRIKTTGLSRQAIPIHINTCRLINSGDMPAAATGAATLLFNLS